MFKRKMSKIEYCKGQLENHDRDISRLEKDTEELESRLGKIELIIKAQGMDESNEMDKFMAKSTLMLRKFMQRDSFKDVKPYSDEFNFALKLYLKNKGRFR